MKTLQHEWVRHDHFQLKKTNLCELKSDTEPTQALSCSPLLLSGPLRPGSVSAVVLLSPTIKTGSLSLSAMSTVHIYFEFQWGCILVIHHKLKSHLTPLQQWVSRLSNMHVVEYGVCPLMTLWVAGSCNSLMLTSIMWVYLTTQHYPGKYPNSNFKVQCAPDVYYFFALW